MQGTHAVLNWLTHERARDWYNGLEEDAWRNAFVIWLQYIATNTKLIGGSDGCFIALNYVVSQDSHMQLFR